MFLASSSARCISRRWAMVKKLASMSEELKTSLVTL